VSLEYSLFTGCVASTREIGYELALRNVFEKLDITLKNVDDFSCCQPACLVHSVDYVKGLALTTRNLAVAEEHGLPMMTLCSSCFGNLSRAKYLLDTNLELKIKVNELLNKAGREYNGSVNIDHVVTALYNDYKIENLIKMISQPLKNIKAAPFYGCHIFMPVKYSQFDDPEHPVKLDNLISLTGAEVIEYPEKTNCCIGCGSFFGEVSEEASVLLAENIVRSAAEKDADCIVTTCPFCIMQLEIGQIKLKEQDKDFGIPVLHYVDLLGLSMGLGPDELGFELRRINIDPVLECILES
jgi:heterodisulfide reductase subunit B